MADAISESGAPPAKRLKMGTENKCKESEEKETDIDAGKMKTHVSVDPKYSNFVTKEELDKLKEFKVLDEVKSNDEDSDNESESSDGKSEVPEEEIEKMLEEDLPDGFKGAPRPIEKPYVLRQKVVLEEKGVNHWEVLPLDWTVVRHYSGMPVYMHRTTRVCTLSKPYFLGKGNTRRHDIPITAIPCLAYRRALEEERKQQEIDRQIEEQIKNGTWVNNVSNQKTNKDESTKTNGASENHETDANIDKNYTIEQNKQLANNVTEMGEPSNNDVSEISNDNLDITNITENVEDKSSHKQDISDDESKSKENSEVIAFNKASDNAMETHKCPYISRNNAENAEYKTDGVCPVTGKTADDVEMKELATENHSQTNCREENNVIEDNTSTENDRANETTEQSNAEVSNENNEVPNNDIEIPKYPQPVVLPGGIVMPAPKVETINNSWKTQHLSHEQVNDYCKALFKFKTVNIMHFNTWADRRKYNKARKTLQYPTLPDGTKLITIPAQPNGQDNGGKPTKRDWVMNMDGRSYLSVFHEYVRRALQKQPVYEFVQLENAATPYQATVYIGGMQYGVGHGSSKRQAKSAAARASIHILIPEMKDELDAPTNGEPDFSFFDYVGIEDPRISEFCAATCEPSPHAILRTCLLRNFGASDRHIHTETKKLEFQKIELTMKVGKHTATVVCKNKKTAKQRASQAILQALHPHVRSWGSLLRLYGSRSVKSFKEKKLEEQQITLLQDRARHNQPNRAVLDKLRRDMLRLKERDAACVPIGTLMLEDDLPTHSGSNLNNVDL